MSEFTTQYFCTLSFPTRFPYGTGDFFINPARTVTYMADWAEHLLEDGRFAKHPYFKFIVHNMISRKKGTWMWLFCCQSIPRWWTSDCFWFKWKNLKWWWFFCQKNSLFWCIIKRYFSVLGTKGKRVKSFDSVQINEKRDCHRVFLQVVVQNIILSP